MINRKQAAYILSNYPSLYEEMENAREDILHGYRQCAVAGGIRGSGYSDTTAKKAILLVESTEMNRLVKLVGEWFDNGLHPRYRPLLLCIWRVGKYGWWTVAKNLKQEECKCRLRWEYLTSQLASYLNQILFAGAVPGLPGAASASGPIKDTQAC